MKSLKKIALIGFGLEAKSAYEFLKNKNPDAIFDIYDQNKTTKVELPEGVNFYGGVTDFSEVWADLIVRTPAVRPDRLPHDVEVTSVTNLFFENCSAPIIGVTGTKGKGTTSSLIASILRASGRKVHLVGNIGLAALDILAEISPEDTVVYEMSSFQLWDLKTSPQVAVILMIEPDHLDVHADFEEYLTAKAQIRAHQNSQDYCIFNNKNQFSKQIGLLDTAKNLKNSFGYGDEEGKIFVRNNEFILRNEDGSEQKICSTDAVKLPGTHNLDNACAAILAAKCFDKNISGEIIEKGLADFTGLPHRLKFVREVRGVKFYDDSISTTPGSAIAAIKAFSENKILLLGGSDKGADLSKLFDEILSSDSIKKVVIYGAQSGKLAEEFRKRNYDNFQNFGEKPDFEEVVKSAFEAAESGESVILSPAHASFDMFSSYADRGEKFVKIVEKLAHENQ
ncbi:MAG: UDP-N-acetylmuramoyl-L-alanine--D-glutamate ligase [bacterium]|nr:UDP-N-acetylmuramoyl-L-alanine--D-glutamate ligase [bacterium]